MLTVDMDPTIQTIVFKHSLDDKDDVLMFREEDLQPTGLSVLNMNGKIVPASLLMNGGRESGDADRQCSTDRSISATPSQNGDDHHQDMDDEAMTMANGSSQLGVSAHNEGHSLNEEISELKLNFVYISHQITRIMRSLHVTPCMCETCSMKHEQNNGVRQKEVSQMLSALFPAATPQQLSTLADLSKMNKGSTPNNRMGTGYAGHPGGGKVTPGIADKKFVAEYARTHGGAAAAKRFGIPPPVSTYYQRKDSNNASPGPSSEGEGDASSQPSDSATTISSVQSAMPTLMANQPATTHQMQPNTGHTVAPTPQPMFTPAMVDVLRMNAAHSTGSPGFLRGRGRGRPKLIGDELDADLVDYMVTVKQADPHGHLTASQALVIAKQYILEKAPGLLDEHGGHVKLKLTWAMKLVSRIAERQKEIELGLPAGSLSNMGRHQLNNLNSMTTGGNFMADVMAQNILNQHMMMSMNQVKQETTAEELKEQPAGATPEILNIKELNLPFLNSLFGSDENSGVIEGELTGEEDQDMGLGHDHAH